MDRRDGRRPGDVRRAAPARARHREPRQQVPARAVPRARPPRLPRPARPRRVGRARRRRRRVRGDRRGGRPARAGLRPDRRPGPALAARLGDRRAAAAVAARHRHRRDRVLRVDQREERRLVVQGDEVDGHPRRRRLGPDREQDAHQPRRRLRRHPVLRDRRGGADLLPGRHDAAGHPHPRHARDRAAPDPHRRRRARPGARARLGPARPGRRKGCRHFLSTFNVSRLGNASELIGLGRRSLELALQYAGTREVGDQRRHRLPGHPVDGRRRVDRAAGRVAGPRRRRGRPTPAARTSRCAPPRPRSWPSPRPSRPPTPPTASSAGTACTSTPRTPTSSTTSRCSRSPAARTRSCATTSPAACSRTPGTRGWHDRPGPRGQPRRRARRPRRFPSRPAPGHGRRPARLADALALAAAGAHDAAGVGPDARAARRARRAHLDRLRDHLAGLPARRAAGRAGQPDLPAGADRPACSSRWTRRSCSGRTRSLSRAAGPRRPVDGLPGLDADRFDVASYMHTSGTTGLPKFCAQTHDYFARLAARHGGGARADARTTACSPRCRCSTSTRWATASSPRCSPAPTR